MSFPQSDLPSGIAGGKIAAAFDEIVGELRGYARGPERGLLAALLFDGVQGFIGYAVAASAADKAQHAEAFRWVMDLTSDGPFSFIGVCDALGVSPEYLRLGLANASTALLHEVGKVRRNF
jgi:hypothetical protein